MRTFIEGKLLGAATLALVMIAATSGASRAQPGNPGPVKGGACKEEGKNICKDPNASVFYTCVGGKWFERGIAPGKKCKDMTF